MSAIERYLEHTGVDWYNEEGGYGSVTLHVPDGEVESEIYSRFTDSVLEFSEEFNLH